MMRLTMSQACIEVKNLNFFYGKQQSLFNINQCFEDKSITAIIGPSGSGKSTLLRVLNKIYIIHRSQVAHGEVWFEGRDIINEPTDVYRLRRHIGMVFQKPTPFPMSIFDNIAFALKTHFKMSDSELKERVEKVLVQAALWEEVKDKLDHAGTRLSGGQQQRLCFARTIAMEPDVLLLDEPTSALDPVSSMKVQELIAKLKSSYTIIMVTHHLSHAKHLADKTVFMKDGHIIESGCTQEIFNAPKNAETKAYIKMA